MAPKAAIELSFPLPDDLSPALLLQKLHIFEPLFRANPRIEEFHEIPTDLEELRKDSFFSSPDDVTVDLKMEDITTYEMHERVPLLPALGLSTVVTIHSTFQRVEDGVRAKAMAPAGTVVHARYTVREAVKNETQEAGDWEFTEAASVECNPLLRPFVARSFEDAHRELGARILQYVVDHLDENPSR